MELYFTTSFVRKYKKLDTQSQNILKKTLKLMEENFSHPSLRIKKMKGYQNPDIWEASASMDLRITFEIEKPKKVILRNCGHHDQTLKNP
ncbi:cytotoxin [Virgibacillus sp. NKC19-16]|uniref:type II toxin-antitoxin system RelE family toxin n=1 Tax=Virgibacillus salidurans TaxID=2831673 RepID=UPI001F43886F|nr:cytotoxin [Virgibacillus sp. NKC19-16]UJL46667.1 cytotoxin [Virgibacillus sp. NKC19-16]